MPAAAKLFKARDPKGQAYTTKLVKSVKDRLDVQATHRRSGLVREHRLPKALFESNAYKELVDAYAKLVADVGRPPLVVSLSEKEQEVGVAAYAKPSIGSS